MEQKIGQRMMIEVIVIEIDNIFLNPLVDKEYFSLAASAVS